MSILSSKFTITKLPGGAIYIAGQPKFVGKFPSQPPDVKNDPEIQELLEVMEAVLKAGNENN